MLIKSLFFSKPDFLIIGAQKAGTTSLYNYLIQHPNVLPAGQKEVHFFDLNYDKGTPWYFNHFPNVLKKKSRHAQIGEATPYYLFHPLAAERSSNILPRVKLIVLLRDPIDRAYSQYYMTKRKGNELRSFEEAIENELEVMEKEEKKIISTQFYNSVLHQRYSYLSRGLYARQLKRWLDRYPQENFLFLQSELLRANTLEVYQQVLSFLGLPYWPNVDFSHLHTGNYPRIKPETQNSLQDFYAPYNEELFDMIGKRLDW